MSTNISAINWFEIPTTDLDRAATFYQTIFATVMERADMGFPMAVFPYTQDSGTGGALVQAPQHVPSADGVCVYLNAAPSIDAVLSRIEVAGGRIVMPKMELPHNIGFIAIMIDTEGNRIGLHARA